MTLVIHPFEPSGRSPNEGEVRTWASLISSSLAGHVTVVNLPTRGTHDLASYLTRVWTTDTIVIVRPGHEAGPALLADLCGCREHLCTVPFMREDGSRSTFMRDRESGAPVTGPDNVLFAEGSYLGVLKIHGHVQSRIAMGPDISDHVLDMVLADRAYAAGVPYHLHRWTF